MGNDDIVNLIELRSSYYVNPGIRSGEVLDAMRKTDRKCFVPREIISYQKPPLTQGQTEHILEGRAVSLKSMVKFVHTNTEKSIYEDEVVPIGHGQTCSQPSMVACMADLLVDGKIDDSNRLINRKYDKYLKGQI